MEQKKQSEKLDVRDYITQVKNGTRKASRHAWDNVYDVAKLWVSGIQKSARCKNAFFEGKEIYSYGRHYLLGVLSEYNGVRLALVNHAYYSKTTSGHQSAARSAAWNAGLITLDVSTFDGPGIRRALRREMNSYYESLAQFYRHGLPTGDNWHRRYMRGGIVEHNSISRRLGHPEFCVSIDREFWTDTAAIHSVIDAAEKSVSSREQTLLDDFVAEVFPTLAGYGNRRIRERYRSAK